MSYQTTKEICGTLNVELQRRYENSKPYMLSIKGKPRLHVLSWDPFAYEEYGILRNRAPFVAGSLALRGFISAPTPSNNAVLYAGVEAGAERYAFMIDPSSPSTLAVMNQVVVDLGHPELYLRANQ